MANVRILLRRHILTVVFCALFFGASAPARAQSNIWDTTISNTNWYVPTSYLLGYASPSISLANPIPIGDQTLWALGVSTNGAFTGTSVAKLAIGPALVTSPSTIQGFVTTSGQITMVFTPTGGGAPTVGLGQMRLIDGVTQMEMQMITGDTLLVTHWAYMVPYNPATFTPPASQVVFANSSPQWAWTSGTPWRIVSPAMFGTTTPGRFIITNYQSGYFWGRGIGPSGGFTLLGSITPEGKVLLSTLSRGTLTSLYGNVVGDPSAAQMLLSQYDLTGTFTGGLASLSLVRPFSETVMAANNRSAEGAADVLYRLTTSLSGFDGAMASALDALNNLNGSALSNAISQTLPVLTGGASQATYNAQRALQQLVLARLDDIGDTGPKNDPVTAEKNIWLKPFGGVARQNSLDGAPGYRTTGGGLAGGIDASVSPDLTLGGMFAYSQNTIKGSEDAVPNTLGVSSYQTGLYGSYALRRDVVTDFQLDAAFNRNNESRSISFMNSVASANYNSYTTHAGLGVKKIVPTNWGLTLIPSLRADFAQINADGYSENGANALNLNVSAQRYRELMVTAGLKSTFPIAERIHVVGNAGVGYNALNGQTQITSSYAGGGDSFITRGLNVSPWLFSAGVGVVGTRKDNLDLSVRYDLQTSSTGYLNQTGSVAIKLKI